MDVPPSPHSSAVSGLMQQLKSGEISKMQLFQEIARLQAKAARSVALPSAPNAVVMPPSSSLAAPPSVPLSLLATPVSALGNMLAPAHSATTRHETLQQFPVAPSYTPAPVAPASTQQQAAPVHFLSTTSGGAMPVSEQLLGATRAASTPGTIGRAGIAPILESDAEFLASGVSHDKAQRFSVQEWMATKQRGSSVAAQPSNGPATVQLTNAPIATSAPSLTSLFSQTNQQQRPQPQQSDEQLFTNHQHTTAAPVSVAPNLFTFSHQRVLGTEEPKNTAPSVWMLDSQGSGVHTNDGQNRENDWYEYNPQRSTLSQQQLPSYMQGSENLDKLPGSSDQEFIDFTEHFREDIDGPGAACGNVSHAGNLTGKSSKIATGNKNTSSGGDDAFHTRVTRWRSQKDAIREQMKQQLLQTELNECTFAPKVNPKSAKVAAKLRARQGSVKEYTSSPLEVSERLYQEADNYKAREELAQRVKAEEEADLERECTFKPKINRTNALTEKVKAKYMDVQKNSSPSFTAAAMESTAKELEQCTFYPKVNPISTEMVSAQLYLQQDIYERLSRPCCMVTTDSPVKSGRLRRRAGSLTDDDISRDTDSDLGSSLASPRRSQDDFYIRSLSPRRHRSSATSSRGAKSADKQRQRQRPRSADGIRNGEEKDERARQLDNFLERQQFHEEARRKKIEATKQHLLHAHKPTINKKSLDMMENGRKGDFLERITKYALRKEHDNVKKKSVRVSDPNCTFKPTINQTSTKRKGRSVTELSRGDLLRRETTQRLMKLKMEQEEMAALTFRPQLNRVSERHEGKLKILTSPDTYLERIHQQSQAHTIKQRRAIQEKELEEFAECTFKPRTIEAPAYVQRIARSVSLTKALKQQQLAAARAGDKPEWK